jgi:pectinesterase
LNHQTWHTANIAFGIITGLFVLLISGCDMEPEREPEPAVPVVMTLETTGISNTSVISGGKVLSVGSLPVTARGVCWNREGSPTVTDLKTIEGSGTGTFASIIEGLEEATGYFVRAYAINPVGIAYGGQEYFVTSTIPTIVTAGVTDITATTAVCGGDVLFCGGASVIVRGVCWNTAGNPTLNDTKTLNGKNIGPYISSLTGLSENTRYYVRAYATNRIGTAYGQEISFFTTR